MIDLRSQRTRVGVWRSIEEKVEDGAWVESEVPIKVFLEGVVIFYQNKEIFSMIHLSLILCLFSITLMVDT